MRILTHNDNAIRMTSLKAYNRVMSEVVSDTDEFTVIKGVEGNVYCGKFIAVIYIGTKRLGRYEFDCRHWKNILTLTDRQMTPKIKKV